MKRSLLPALATAVALSATAAGAHSQPQEIERVAGRVTLLRDEWGTPHVYAAREADGYFGWGYAMAEDRLHNLLWRYIAAEGRLSETFGPAAPARYLGALDFPASNLEADAVHLRFMAPEHGRAGYSRLEPQLRANYAAFAAGIERFMANHPDRVPEWAPKRIDPVGQAVAHAG